MAVVLLAGQFPPPPPTWVLAENVYRNALRELQVNASAVVDTLQRLLPLFQLKRTLLLSACSTVPRETWALEPAQTDVRVVCVRVSVCLGTQRHSTSAARNRGCAEGSSA